MIDIIIRRKYGSEKQTLGSLVAINSNGATFKLKTLELAWKDNEQFKSCIPDGTYKAVHYSSEAYPQALQLLAVPDRFKILIHNGNYKTDTKGCILVGKRHYDIDGDNYKDVTSSKPALRELLAFIGGDNDITIKIS